VIYAAANCAGYESIALETILTMQNELDIRSQRVATLGCGHRLYAYRLDGYNYYAQPRMTRDIDISRATTRGYRSCGEIV